MAGYRKLGLATDQRRAMLRSLVTSFLKHGRIETTETRAKETRSIAEKMITLAKRGDLQRCDPGLWHRKDCRSNDLWKRSCAAITGSGRRNVL